MLTKRRRTLIFIEAGILTFVVFLLSILSNSYLDDKRFDDLNEKLLEGAIESDLSFTENEFYSTFEIENCVARKANLYSQFQNIKKLGTDITNYGQLTLKINEEVSKNKKRDYFLDELRLYGDVLQYNGDCEDKVLPVLYFYNGLSTSLDKQSLILEQFSLNKKNQTLIFSFDYFIDDEPILNNFKEDLNVRSTPFIFINGKTTNELSQVNRVVSLNTLTIEYKKFKGEI